MKPKKNVLRFFFFFLDKREKKANQYSRVHHECAFSLMFSFVKLQSDPWQKLMPNCVISLLQPRVAPQINRRRNKYPGPQHSLLSHHTHSVHQAMMHQAKLRFSMKVVMFQQQNFNPDQIYEELLIC